MYLDTRPLREYLGIRDPAFRKWLNAVDDDPAASWSECGHAGWMLELARALPVRRSWLLKAELDCIWLRLEHEDPDLLERNRVVTTLHETAKPLLSWARRRTPIEPALRTHRALFKQLHATQSPITVAHACFAMESVLNDAMGLPAVTTAANPNGLTWDPAPLLPGQSRAARERFEQKLDEGEPDLLRRMAEAIEARIPGEELQAAWETRRGTFDNHAYWVVWAIGGEYNESMFEQDGRLAVDHATLAELQDAGCLRPEGQAWLLSFEDDIDAAWDHLGNTETMVKWAFAGTKASIAFSGVYACVLLLQHVQPRPPDRVIREVERVYARALAGEVVPIENEPALLEELRAWRKQLVTHGDLARGARTAAKALGVFTGLCPERRQFRAERSAELLAVVAAALCEDESTHHWAHWQLACELRSHIMRPGFRNHEPRPKRGWERLDPPPRPKLTLVK